MNRRSFLRGAFAGAVSLPFAALAAAEVAPSAEGDTWIKPVVGRGGAGGGGRVVGSSGGSGGGAGPIVWVYITDGVAVSS